MTLSVLMMRIEGYRLALRLRRGPRRQSAFYALVLAIGAYDRARNKSRCAYDHEMNMRIEHSFEATFGVSP